MAVEPDCIAPIWKCRAVLVEHPLALIEVLFGDFEAKEWDWLEGQRQCPGRYGTGICSTTHSNASLVGDSMVRATHIAAIGSSLNLSRIAAAHPAKCPPVVFTSSTRTVTCFVAGRGFQAQLRRMVSESRGPPSVAFVSGDAQVSAVTTREFGNTFVAANEVATRDVRHSVAPSSVTP